jgi:hypothetical protein
MLKNDSALVQILQGFAANSLGKNIVCGLAGTVGNYTCTMQLGELKSAGQGPKKKLARSIAAISLLKQIDEEPAIRQKLWIYYHSKEYID